METIAMVAAMARRRVRVAGASLFMVRFMTILPGARAPALFAGDS
jgi:hypothetical protein